MRPIFDVPAPPLIPVEGEAGGYPIGRIFCVGRNYAAHAAEMGNEVDREAPFYFTKSPGSAVLSGAEVPYPPGTTDYHHEMEFCFALGREVFRADPDTAGEAVFAGGAALDMTRRDLQAAAKDKRRPWDTGKDVEGSAVFGPLRRGFVPSGQAITLAVNGEVRQSAHLSEMVWSVPEIIAHLSTLYHLRPGDLVLTGTPAGVGPVVAGDRLWGEIEGLPPVALSIGPPD